MKILVLGSEGFIGSHCISYFLKKGYEVYGCDLLDYKTQNYTYTKISRLNPDFDNLFDSTGYEFCINAAGNGSVPISIEKPIQDFDANCNDVIKLLQLLKDKNPGCKYLHFSSAAVYGNPQALPVREDALLQPLSPYGWHKLIAEKLCEEYSALYNLSIAVVRPFSVYGPGLRKQLLWDMYQKSKASSTVEFWGDGTESRDFIYIDDLIAAVDMILRSKQTTFAIYNVATGEETRIDTIAENFYKALGSPTSYSFNGKSRSGDPKNWRADINKLTSIGYRPAFTLKMGLELTAEWIKKLG